jgi:hypothetical protein
MHQVPLALLGLFLLACGGAEAGGGPSGLAGRDASSDALADAPSVSLADAGADAPVDVDSGACVILASNYDQSCSVDSDCAMVSSGNYCVGGCFCGGSAINVGASARFAADVARAQVGVPPGPGCGCGAEFGPCCIAGKCQAGYAACLAPPSDTLAACADAGGTCARFIEECGARGLGPSNSCAYPDEMCCLH